MTEAATLNALRDELAARHEAQTEVMARYLVKFPKLAPAIRRITEESLASAAIDDEVTVVTERLKNKGRDADSAPTGESGEISTRQPGRSFSSPQVDLPQEAPRFLGDFRVLRELGRGGMGVVYLGADDTMSRLVAIKVLPAEYGHQHEFLERFRREQEAVSRLQHPGIVQVYATGEQEGIHYFVMQYVKGRPLNHLLSDFWRAFGIQEQPDLPDDSEATARDPIAQPIDSVDSLQTWNPESVSDFLHIIERTARALHFAHENGVIHRDIKPENIVIDEEGNPVLLDFGLARQSHEQTMTRSGSILGTVPYMSPEQVSARKKDIDHRTDLYSLGVVLYEGLTGARPFHSENLETLMMQIVSQDPQSLRTQNGDLGQDIETVVLKCLEKHPHRRFANCLALAEELERIRAHQRILSEPVGRLGRLARWASDNRLLAGLTIAALIGALLIVAVLIQGELESSRLEREAAAEQARLGRENVEAAISLHDDEKRLTNLRRRLMAQDPSFDVAAELQRVRRDLRELRNRRLRLYRDAVARFDESTKLDWNAGVTASRSAALISWYRAGEDLQDDALCKELARRLQDAGVAVPASQGALSLVTRPAGARVRARRWTESGDGRLTLSEKEIDLGVTPLTERQLPLGCWQVSVSHEATEEISYPVLIERDEHWGSSGWHRGRFSDKDWSLTLPQRGSFDPKEWSYVAAGPFQRTYPRFYKETDHQVEWAWEDSFLIRRREVSFAEYTPFLELALGAESGFTDYVKTVVSPSYHEGPDTRDRFKLSENGRLEVIADGGRSEEDFMNSPVCGIGAFGAERFAMWKATIEKKKYALPTAAQWEKAARGVDARTYPWGNGFDWSFVAARRSLERPIKGGSLPLLPGSRPLDLSPYGCLDMAGNAAEWCAERDEKSIQVVAGGALMDTTTNSFAAWPRSFLHWLLWRDHLGFRLAINLP